MSKLILLTFVLGRGPFKTLDPFLFCVYHNDAYPKGEDNMGPHPSLLSKRDIGSDFSYIDGWSMYHGDSVPGFPSHPHRGFETISVTQRGIIDHSDSLGLTGRYGNGDTQWMTAGRGVQHAEMMPLVLRDAPNPMQMYQIWLNLPKKDKFAPPGYTMFWNEEQPTVSLQDSNGHTTSVRVIAGHLNGVTGLKPPAHSWAADEANDVGVWVVDIPAGGSFEFPATESTSHRALYFVEGDKLDIAGKQVSLNTGVQVDAAQSFTVCALNKPAQILMLQGKPIAEPVRQHGPFVMNTHEEILQCFEDYRRTQFGGWPWKSSQPVHSRDTDRHTKHPDGTIEKPPAACGNAAWKN